MEVKENSTEQIPITDDTKPVPAKKPAPKAKANPNKRRRPKRPRRPKSYVKVETTSDKVIRIFTTALFTAAILIVASAFIILRISNYSTKVSLDIPAPLTKLVSLFDPTTKWEYGYIATSNTEVSFYSAEGLPVGTLPRGAKVKYNIEENSATEISYNGIRGFLHVDAYIVEDVSDVIPAHKLYVRTSVNLRDKDGHLLETFAEKGSTVDVIGYDYFKENGDVHMYRVNLDGTEGYIMPWYLVNKKYDATANYDGDGNYFIHEGREDLYGGGFGANLDYFPREKGNFEDNVMPDECRALYVIGANIGIIDQYLAIAAQSDINTFVVDITDGKSMAYASDVMHAYSPTSAAMAHYTVEEYRAAIQKIKDAGYYVVGRITTFNDTYFIMDHPECAITTPEGDPLQIDGVYWPSAFNRYAWQYKVDLAVEAVQLMGFDEINFDYIRFPDNTSDYEEAGTIDFHNVYNETRAQAVQRFLMYATDILHEQGVYVSADVYGEIAYGYITSYGQYWSSISNVADVICGMPYPDHFGISDGVRPWEQPYETLYNWGRSAMRRQSETATPAIVRTWVQAYDAIKPPYNIYGPEEVLAEINGLRDAGCTGGYMTWNGTASLEKYEALIPAFTERKN